MERATNLSQVRVNCQYYALDRDERQVFYVDTSKARGVDVLERLKSDFDYVKDMYQQVLFLGHIGTGKSTLLYQLERNLRGTYRVIRFSVQEYLDMESITMANLLFVMYERIFNECSDDLDENSDILKELYKKWNAVTTIEYESERTAELQVSGEVELSIKAKIIKLLSKLSSTLKFGTKECKTICSVIKNDINDYIHLLNELIEAIYKKDEKPLLLIFEDLEKISSEDALRIFKTDGPYFRQINLHLLLTTPIFLKYHTSFKNIISQNFTFTERCPIIAVSNDDGSENGEGIEIMCEIVNKRVDEKLINRDALKKAVKYSGGVIRDLLWMIGEAARICKTSCINECDVDKAFYDLQILYGDGLRQKQVEIIKRVYNNPFCLVDEDDNDDNELKLMQAEVIIEYNGKQWRGVHPAVVQYLKDRNLLPTIE